MRNAAVVALTLLEVIRAQDLPTEVLEEEDPSVTLPRRLGLSDVVEQQIRRYREEVRRRQRISDDQVGDLFQLVLRRPDAEDIFFQAGEMLVGRDQPPRVLGKVYPRRIAYALARRQVRRRLKSLFGRSLGGFGKGPFSLEGRSLLFVKHDPGGDACEMLSGFCQATLQRYIRRPVVVFHSFCQARGDPYCRWTAHEDLSALPDSVGARLAAVGEPASGAEAGSVGGEPGSPDGSSDDVDEVVEERETET
jgi:hypothetical protein